MERIPDEMIGLWRRLRLEETDGRVDTDTEVYWLQTHGAYVDLRIPPGRPGFDGAVSPDHLSEAQLHWLARQQGFAGRLSLRGEVATWQRELDYQPPARVDDVGRLARDGRRLVERGVLVPYTEDWEHQGGDAREVLALKLLGEEDARGPRPRRAGYLVAVGEYFMFALGRHVRLPRGTQLEELLAAGPVNLERRRVLFDCIIDFGLRRGGACPWQILRSTQPWREGGPPPELGRGPARRGRTLVETADEAGVRRRWEVIEDAGGILASTALPA